MKMHNKLHVLWMLLILMVPMLLMVSVANAQPANDDFANATVIPFLPFTIMTTTGAATVSPDDPSNCSFPLNNTVWYKGTSGSDLSFEANTFGSDYDTTLTVVTVTGSPGSFNLIACNDDAQGSSQSQVIFNVKAGTTYYFMVGSKVSGGGDLVFNAINLGQPTTTTTTPPDEEIEASVDIKPGSCPNPIGNANNRGVVPFAIMGTVDFDITQIDPESIRITRDGVDAEVAPIRWSYEDVATPFEGELCDCHELTDDGYIDLSMKVYKHDLVYNLKLQEVAGQTIPLTITGKLKDEFGGTSIKGQDCVRVLKTVIKYGKDKDKDKGEGKGNGKGKDKDED